MKHDSSRLSRDQKRLAQRMGTEVAVRMRPRISASAMAIGVQPRPRERKRAYEIVQRD